MLALICLPKTKKICFFFSWYLNQHVTEACFYSDTWRNNEFKTGRIETMAQLYWSIMFSQLNYINEYMNE